MALEGSDSDMRGIGYTLSRLPQVRVLIAAAMISAGPFATAAHGQGSGSGNGSGALTPNGARADEAALSISRIGHGTTPGVAIPHPLSPSDIAVTRRIFALQGGGEIAEAIRAGGDLREPLLMGPLLADRYLGHFYRSTAQELSDWLDHYGDQSDARSIRALLLTKLPKGTPLPATPDVATLPQPAVPEAAGASRDELRQYAGLDRSALDQAVIDRAQRGDPTQALRLIASARRISPADAARLRAEVAQVFFIRNDDADALRIVEDLIRDIPPSDQNSLTYLSAA